MHDENLNVTDKMITGKMWYFLLLNLIVKKRKERYKKTSFSIVFYH